MYTSDVPIDPDASWPMLQYDAQNTSYNPGASVPGEITAHWRYTACREVDQIVTLTNGRLYAGKAIIDARNGSHRSGVWNGYQRPAIADDTLFVGSRNLEAYDATDGSELWTFDTAGQAGGVSAPTVYDGRVYIAGKVDDPTLYAVDAERGKEDWQFTPDHDYNTSPATDGDRVYIVDRGGIIYAIDAGTGSEEWRYGTEESDWKGPPAVSDGSVFVGSFDGEVVALDKINGQKRWRQSTGTWQGVEIAVGEETVFAPWREGCAAFAKSDGTERWRTEEAGGQACSVASDTLVVGGDKLEALAITDGTKIWEFQPRYVTFYDYRARRVRVAPIVLDGFVFAGTQASDIYALGPVG